MKNSVPEYFANFEKKSVPEFRLLWTWIFFMSHGFYHRRWIFFCFKIFYILKGASNMARPPNDAHTTVNTLQNPEIFVIYHDAQAYPEYLLTYE
jgi:hypothetical protein